MTHVEVFVIGAGPAGLTVPRLLPNEGNFVGSCHRERPSLCSAVSSRTVRYKDYLFDIGGHRFFSKAKEVVDLWQEI